MRTSWTSTWAKTLLPLLLLAWTPSHPPRWSAGGPVKHSTTSCLRVQSRGVARGRYQGPWSLDTCMGSNGRLVTLSGRWRVPGQASGPVHAHLTSSTPTKAIFQDPLGTYTLTGTYISWESN